MGSGKSAFIRNLKYLNGRGPQEGKKQDAQISRKAPEHNAQKVLCPDRLLTHMSSAVESRTHTIHLLGRTVGVGVVDTPGFNHDRHTNADALTVIALTICNLAREGVDFLGCIYLHTINRKVDASSQRAVRIVEEMCGPDADRRVFFVTSKWEDAFSDGNYEGRLDQVNELLGRNRAAGDLRHNGTQTSAQNIMNRLLSKQEKWTMSIQEEFGKGFVPLATTKVGKLLLRQVSERREENTISLQEDIKKDQCSGFLHQEKLQKELDALTNESLNLEFDSREYSALDTTLVELRCTQNEGDAMVAELTASYSKGIAELQRLLSTTQHPDRCQTEATRLHGLYEEMRADIAALGARQGHFIHRKDTYIKQAAECLQDVSKSGKLEPVESIRLMAEVNAMVSNLSSSGLVAGFQKVSAFPIANAILGADAASVWTDPAAMKMSYENVVAVKKTHLAQFEALEQEFRKLSHPSA